MLLRWIFAALLTSSLLGCDKPKENVLVVGTISGPESVLIETAKDEALKRYGLQVKVVEFSDYNLPNEALREGTLDANVYQHQPYLDAAMAARGYAFEVIGKTFVYPMGLYSSKHKTMAALPQGATLALPNDPSNEARALKLLARRGFIKLKPSAMPSVKDIEENPHQFKFKTMDAAQLPRVLPDVDGALINTTFAMPAGLHPEEDALLLEGKGSPYANLIVARKGGTKKEKLNLFVEAFHSDAVKEKAKQTFQDGAIPAW